MFNGLYFMFIKETNIACSLKMQQFLKINHNLFKTKIIVLSSVLSTVNYGTQYQTNVSQHIYIGT